MRGDAGVAPPIVLSLSSKMLRHATAVGLVRRQGWWMGQGTAPARR
jgi:hypothetical protein